MPLDAPCVHSTSVDSNRLNLERFGLLTNGLHREQIEPEHSNNTTVTNDMIMGGDNATRMTFSSFQELQLMGTEPVRTEAPTFCFIVAMIVT